MTTLMMMMMQKMAEYFKNAHSSLGCQRHWPLPQRQRPVSQAKLSTDVYDWECFLRLEIISLHTFDWAKSEREKRFEKNKIPLTCHFSHLGLQIRFFFTITLLNFLFFHIADIFNGKTFVSDVNMVAEPKVNILSLETSWVTLYIFAFKRVYVFKTKLHQTGRKRQNTAKTGNDWDYYYDR